MGTCNFHVYCRIDEIVLRSQELMTAEKIKQELRTPRYYGDKKAGPEGGKFIHDGELSSILNVRSFYSKLEFGINFNTFRIRL